MWVNFGDNSGSCHVKTKFRAQLTHTVVTEAAVGGTRWSEDFAGKAIFQLDSLTIDDDLLGPGRRSVARAAIGHICGEKDRT